MLALALLLLQLPISPAGFTAAYIKGGKPVPMQQAMPAGTKTAGAGRTFLSAGIAKPQVYWWFRGAHAQVQISDSTPSFELRAPYVPASSFVVIRLDAKKHERDLHVSTGATIFSSGSGFDPKDVEPMTVTAKDGGVIDLVAAKPLAPGEYLIAREGIPFGYDFEIK